MPENCYFAQSKLIKLNQWACVQDLSLCRERSFEDLQDEFPVFEGMLPPNLTSLEILDAAHR